MAVKLLKPSIQGPTDLRLVMRQKVPTSMPLNMKTMLSTF